MTSKPGAGDHDPVRLRERLAEIERERASVLDGSWPGYAEYSDELAQEVRSDALHDLAREEARIRAALGLPPGPWAPDPWPEWVGWAIITLLSVSIPLLAWLTG